MSGGIYLTGANHNLIQGNIVTNCSLHGIQLERSDDNVILNNFFQSNGTDLIWDGYGQNIWMRNEFNTVNNTDIIDSNEATIRNLGSQLEEINAEKIVLENELEYAYEEISDLEGNIGELNADLTNLEAQLSTANSDIADLGSQLESLQEEIESLEEEIASRLTYSTAGIIAVLAAIVFGAAGFYVAKRM